MTREQDRTAATGTSGQKATTPGARSGVRVRTRHVRERVRAHPVLDTTWRAGIFVVGWVVILGGLLMLVLPGPGWAAIFIGFAILATEFVWARRALHKAKRVAHQATEMALDPRVRRRNQAIAAGGVILAILGAGMFVWMHGVPYIH